MVPWARLQPLRTFSAEPPSLWLRMGGEEVIRPLCNDLYDLHASDPLTAPWFGPDKEGNIRKSAEAVKENVFTFFSSGIGGPHTYEGRDMQAAHKHMKLANHAVLAIKYHVIQTMEKHSAGGAAEREEVLSILNSLTDDVMSGGGATYAPAEGSTLYERMGGEAVIRPMCSDLYDLHASDPLTAPWFGSDKPKNIRTAEEVKENVFTFFSSGIGGPHEYKGRDMKAAHAHMTLPDCQVLAIMYHVMATMEKHGAGMAEREEVLAILESLVPDVQSGSAASS